MFFTGSVWCALATDLTGLLIGRVIQAAGACATSVLSRAIARDMFSGAALARAMALIMIAMAAAPGFSPLLGGALDHYFGWRSEFVLVAAFAALGALAYAAVFGETHHATRTPLDPLAIAKNLSWPDRRPPLRRAGRDREPDHGRPVLDVLGRAAHPDRGDALHADSTGPVLRRHRADRIRRRHARDQAGAALRARPLDPRRIVGGRHRQHRDAAGLAVQPDFPVRISAR